MKYLRAHDGRLHSLLESLHALRVCHPAEELPAVRDACDEFHSAVGAGIQVPELLVVSVYAPCEFGVQRGC